MWRKLELDPAEEEKIKDIVDLLGVGVEDIGVSSDDHPEDIEGIFEGNNYKREFVKSYENTDYDDDSLYLITLKDNSRIVENLTGCNPGGTFSNYFNVRGIPPYLKITENQMKEISEIIDEIFGDKKEMDTCEILGKAWSLEDKKRKEGMN